MIRPPARISYAHQGAALYSLLALNGPLGLFYKTFEGNEPLDIVHLFKSNSVLSTVFLAIGKMSLGKKAAWVKCCSAIYMSHVFKL